MPREIKVYCEFCDGEGYYDKPLGNSQIEFGVFCPKCNGDGYLYHTYYDGIELDKAVQDEREGCALMFDEMAKKYINTTPELAAEAIRNRGAI